MCIRDSLRNSERKVHLTEGMDLRPDWSYIKNIMKIGIPNGVENSMFQLGKLILLSMISGFGTISIAANAVEMCIRDRSSTGSDRRNWLKMPEKMRT